jgi:hypothetical protein
MCIIAGRRSRTAQFLFRREGDRWLSILKRGPRRIRIGPPSSAVDGNITEPRVASMRPSRMRLRNTCRIRGIKTRQARCPDGASERAISEGQAEPCSVRCAKHRRTRAAICASVIDSACTTVAPGV